MATHSDYVEILGAFVSIIMKDLLDEGTVSLKEDFVDLELTCKVPKNRVWNQMMKNGRDEFESEVKFPQIKKVIFNGPATIVFWSDATKTVVKCQEDDAGHYSKISGLALCIAKKAFGNTGRYFDAFKELGAVDR